MPTGLATITLANRWLAMLRGVAFTAPTGLYVKLHTADPGVAAANAPAAGSTTRVAVTLGTESGGSISLTGTNPVWTNSGTTETVSHVSVWDASTGGNLLWTTPLATPQAWAGGNTFTLNVLGVALAPLAS